MKLAKTYPLLLKEGNTKTREFLEELEQNNFKGPIEDWDTFIALLHEKNLSQESEVVLINYLASNILEGQFAISIGQIQSTLDKTYKAPAYQNTQNNPAKININSNNQNTNETKTILNLLNILSFKVKSGARSSIVYGILYCYLSGKIYGKLQDFNEGHKKIKQRIEEDAKHLARMFDLCSQEESLKKASQTSQQTQITRQFIVRLTKLVRLHPILFKSQAKYFEHTVFNSLYRISQSIIGQEVINLLAELPACTNTSAAYPEKVKTSISLYAQNLLYSFLFVCRGVEESSILSLGFFEDSFKAAPQLLFDWQGLKTSKQPSKIISEQIQQKMEYTYKLLVATIRRVRTDSVQAWPFMMYLQGIQQILSQDYQVIEKHNATHSNKDRNDSLLNKFDVSALEDNKLVLDGKSYYLVSIKAKHLSLKFLNILVQATQHSIAQYSTSIYDLLYKASLQLETHDILVIDLLKITQTLLNVSHSLFYEFAEYLFFSSPSAPLENLLPLLITIYDQTQESENSEKLAISILSCLQKFLSSCGRLLTKPELIAQIDSVFSGIMSQPDKLTALPYAIKKQLLSCLEQVLLQNMLKFEESLLLPEVTRFCSEYTNIESDKELLGIARGIRVKIFGIRQSKRVSFIENSLDVAMFVSGKVSQLRQLGAAETQDEEGTQQREQLYSLDFEKELDKKEKLQNSQQPPQNSLHKSEYFLGKTQTQEIAELEEHEIWGEQSSEQKNNSTNSKKEISKMLEIGLKRTFTELVMDDVYPVDSSAETQTTKKQIIEANKKQEAILAKTQSNLSENKSQVTSNIFNQNKEPTLSIFHIPTTTQAPSLFPVQQSSTEPQLFQKQDLSSKIDVESSENNQNNKDNIHINNSNENNEEDEDEIILCPIIDSD